MTNGTYLMDVTRRTLQGNDLHLEPRT
jgi:hypothetical protein